MNILRSISTIGFDRNSVVTVGTFDGVTIAHRQIVRELVHRARMSEGRSVLVTFDPHPKSVVSSLRGPVQLLSTIDERIERLAKLEIDILLILDFTVEFSQLSPREFYERYIIKGIGVSEVVVGYDHMFGKDRTAGIEWLVKMGRENGFSVLAMQPFKFQDEPVSSTRVRKALLTGDVDQATNLLGHEYSIAGRVIEGDRRGRLIGYPTANIEPLAPNKIIPGNGVYLVKVGLGERSFFGMMNIGNRPTVTDGSSRTIEVHIFELEEDIYDQEIDVSFIRKLRDEKKFASIEQLKDQLGADKFQSLEFVRNKVK